MTSERLAILAATSGHSGVDRVIGNLARQFSAWGIGVDLLKVRRHGPDLHVGSLPHARTIDLGASHVNTSLPALVRYLRRERPAAMLTDKDRVNRIAILARVLARSQTPLVVRIGTTVSVNLASRTPFQRWQQRRSICHLYPFADAVVVPSEGVASDLAEHTGLARSRIRVVRSPIVTPWLGEQARGPVDHPWLADAQVPVVLGVGELSYRKDFATLIRAFALLHRRIPCRLLILGRGRQREVLLQLAGELGVAEHVDLPGFVDNPYAYMARSRLFVLSSRWEGMPVVLVEALACRVPVVATDCPSGPREILGNHRVGALVPVGDHQAMAVAMEQWLGEEVTDFGFEQAVADYRVEASACAYLRVLGRPCPELSVQDESGDGEDRG